MIQRNPRRPSTSTRTRLTIYDPERQATEIRIRAGGLVCDMKATGQGQIPGGIGSANTMEIVEVALATSK
jgi:hypothetical protein